MYLQKCTSFVTSNGCQWDVKCHVTCNSLNVVYFLICNFCKITSKTGKTDNLRQRTNNHITACRHGKSSDVFDNHVYQCSKNYNIPHDEPFFKLYVYMACSDYNKLLNIERSLHVAGHDTLNNPLLK